jgi:hypothetical protein
VVHGRACLLRRPDHRGSAASQHDGRGGRRGTATRGRRHGRRDRHRRRGCGCGLLATTGPRRACVHRRSARLGHPVVPDRRPRHRARRRKDRRPGPQGPAGQAPWRAHRTRRGRVGARGGARRATGRRGGGGSVAGGAPGGARPAGRRCVPGRGIPPGRSRSQAHRSDGPPVLPADGAVPHDADRQDRPQGAAPRGHRRRPDRHDRLQRRHDPTGTAPVRRCGPDASAVGRGPAPARHRRGGGLLRRRWQFGGRSPPVRGHPPHIRRDAAPRNPRASSHGA